ncbi:MAG: LysR family transcriptional regulator [Sandaracinus sp.]|nr:LysR family transcriptional regulator [Sandaracinus sp.]MCB9622594.1 LysR family transcriptional regulator [Sandaracinus sp.]MCB9635614.1 LysR family transcriptional regulator [Sandaracinus sp.]
MTVRSDRTRFDHRDLPLLAVFASVARHGSFTAAAGELGLAKSVVSEQVRNLEARIGVRLLERTTRRVRCTQVGDEVREAAERMLEAAAEVRRAADAHRDAPTGTLRVAATLDLGVRFVAPAVATVCERYPNLRVELALDDSETDLIAAGVDVALRLGVPKDSRLVTRKLAVDREIVVASPSLAHAWPASRPRELQGAPWLLHGRLARLPMRFHGPRRGEDTITVKPARGVASTADALRALARGGVGFAVLPLHLVEDDLRVGALVRVCEPWYRREIGIHLMLPSRRDAPRRTTVLVEELTRRVTEWSRGVR